MGKWLAGRLGLPQPQMLDRYQTGQSLLVGPVLFGHSAGAQFAPSIQSWLTEQSAPTVGPQSGSSDARLKSVIYDASGIMSIEQTRQLPLFFSSQIKRFGKCARVVIVGQAPETCTPEQHVAQRSLLGFVKALAKEMRHGGSVNLIWADPDAGHNLWAPLGFFASDQSAYVSGQMLRVHSSGQSDSGGPLPLSGRSVLVTGAARGIGRAIATLMQGRGAQVCLLDIPKAEADLKEQAERLQGTWLTADITAADAGQKIAAHFADRRLDVLVHNAGITRDKKLVNMQPEMWDAVIATNLSCQERINRELIQSGTLSSSGRVVLVSSISGIAGNAGQTNYSCSKAGVIGMVEAYAERFIQQGITLNAVAPGFIETDMIATIPFALRQAGRRLNSMSQGGLPEDVAQAVAMFAQASSQGVYGNVLRVCGQALMGA
jgi:3-oxoacyl-[acyl-carrier protein] reductase